MSKKESPKNNQSPQAPKGSPVAAHPVQTQNSHHKEATVHQLNGGCMAEICKKKSEKAGFCMEHFDWFKEGLITKEGRKPSDFEKKYFNYMQRRKPAA